MVGLHTPDQCAGRPCVFHQPTDHHMRGWRLIWRADRRPGLFERICKHGCGHPDPDQFDYWEEAGLDYMSIHGCCGCCGLYEIGDA